MTPKMHRFPKSARIKGAKAFREVKRRGLRARAGFVSVAVLLGERQRLGIVVSREVGKAVERNRIKRVIREHFRQNRDKFPKGDCVVIVAPRAGELENEAIREYLVEAVEKMKLKIGSK